MKTISVVLTQSVSIINLALVSETARIQRLRLSELYYLNINTHSVMTIGLEGFNNSIVSTDSVTAGVFDQFVPCFKAIFLGGASAAAEVRYSENVHWDYKESMLGCWEGPKSQNVRLSIMFDGKVASDQVTPTNPVMMTFNLE